MDEDGGWPHLRATYDAVAGVYTDTFSDELAGKPFDRRLLDDLADSVAASGGGEPVHPVADLGCGPGQIGAYLAGRGCRVLGVDASVGILARGRARHPGLAMAAGDLRALPLASYSCAAVTCFYALIHCRRGRDVHTAVAELARVLRPGGRLLLAVHEGRGERRDDDWFGLGVRVDVTLFQAEELDGPLEEAGFTDREVLVRGPYPGERTSRLYVRARRG